MDAKTKINQYRERLDKTLACSDLTDETSIRTKVKSRLLQSTEYGTEGDIANLLEKRTNELLDFLVMLRSASLNDDRNTIASGVSNAEWKVKQDTEECRVMYREGPPGTPFHVLLVEGYLDGPVDAGLCVAWETTLYKNWWPQFNYPAFKITSSRCVHQIGTHEQICTVRVKVPWPLSAREALLHYYEFEFFQEDLIVVVIKTIDDVESDGSLYGITNGMIPESNNAVRLGVVGGLAIQKVNNERCYFRLIASLDMKLDFVSPSLINFIARQLIGNGFKLCQKAVTSISEGNKDFSKALEGPMYNRIRQAIHLPDIRKVLQQEVIKTEEEKSMLEDERLTKSMQFDGNVIVIDHGVLDSEIATSPTYPPPKSLDDVSSDVDLNVVFETEEEESKLPSFKVANSYNGMNGKKICPRPEVEQALSTLDRVIEAVRELHINEDISSNASRRHLEMLQKPLKNDSHEPALRDKKSGLTAGEVKSRVFKQISNELHQVSLHSSTSEIATVAVHAKSIANDIASVGLGVHECSVENVKVGRPKNPNTIFCWPCNPGHR